jgi:hypothetical protein
LLTVRPATLTDADAIWSILKPTLREGESYALPRNWSQSDALAYWFSPHHEVFVAEEEGLVIGTYYLRANQSGGGAHVANCWLLLLAFAPLAAAVAALIASAALAATLPRATIAAV